MNVPLVASKTPSGLHPFIMATACLNSPTCKRKDHGPRAGRRPAGRSSPGADRFRPEGPSSSFVGRFLMAAPDQSAPLSAGQRSGLSGRRRKATLPTLVGTLGAHRSDSISGKAEGLSILERDEHLALAADAEPARQGAAEPQSVDGHELPMNSAELRARRPASQRPALDNAPETPQGCARVLFLTVGLWLHSPPRGSCRSPRRSPHAPTKYTSRTKMGRDWACAARVPVPTQDAVWHPVAGT